MTFPSPDRRHTARMLSAAGLLLLVSVTGPSLARLPCFSGVPSSSSHEYVYGSAPPRIEPANDTALPGVKWLPFVGDVMLT